MRKLILPVSLLGCGALVPLAAVAMPPHNLEKAPIVQPAPKPPRNCDIPPPTSTPPTDDFKAVLKCLATLGLNIGGRLACTDDDIQRPPTCPPEPGSTKDDPLGYTNCDYQQSVSAETVAMYQDMLEDLDIPVDAETASLVAAPQKPGAAWVECSIAGGDLLSTALHEACHLIKQCDKSKPIDEVEAAKCTDDLLNRIRNSKSYTTCRKLLRATPASSTE